MQNYVAYCNGCTVVTMVTFIECVPLLGSGRSPGEGNDYPLQGSCWEIPRTKEPGGLQSMGSQRGGQDWATKHTFTLFQAPCCELGLSSSGQPHEEEELLLPYFPLPCKGDSKAQKG